MGALESQLPGFFVVCLFVSFRFLAGISRLSVNSAGLKSQLLVTKRVITQLTVIILTKLAHLSEPMQIGLYI